VSFNIGRIRTPDEPRGAAWSRFGPIQSKLHLVDGRESRYGISNSYVDGHRNSWIGACHRDAGCMFALRKIKDENRELVISRRGKRKLADAKEFVEDEFDEDWMQQEVEEDDEPLEYASDADEGIIEESHDVDMEDADNADRETTEREYARRFWTQAFMENKWSNDYASFSIADYDNDKLPAWYKERLRIERIDIGDDEMFPLFYPAKDDVTEYGTDNSLASDDDGSSSSRLNINHYWGGKLGYYTQQDSDVEHIAGPGCLNRAGYSGHEISVEEMRGCQVAQCLVRKPQGWNGEPWEDDEDFEKTGAFFLSGLTDFMPSRDMNYPRVRPSRHGCEKPHAENFIWDEEEYAMPFHPSCFEIFKRASMLENDIIDVDGLTSWWTKDALTHGFDKNFRNGDVYRCKEQEWSHWKGTEYLAANPLYIPKLQDILQDATDIAPKFSPRKGAFTISGWTNKSSGNDPFTLLPTELQFEILDNLCSKDVASLRLASHAFRQLPISYFKKLLNRDMPWLWEAWPTLTKLNDLPYSFWATRTPREAEIELEKTHRAISCLKDYVKIVTSEMSELKPVFEEALPAEIQRVLDAHQLEIENEEDRKPFFLPPDRTDYHLLYVLITRHWKELRGLQNRKRIWENCGSILKEIKRLRTNGEIEPLTPAS
jgi:hypothetical protein